MIKNAVKYSAAVHRKHGKQIYGSREQRRIGNTLRRRVCRGEKPPNRGEQNEDRNIHDRTRRGYLRLVERFDIPIFPAERYSVRHYADAAQPVSELFRNAGVGVLVRKKRGGIGKQRDPVPEKHERDGEHDRQRRNIYPFVFYGLTLMHPLFYAYCVTHMPLMRTPSA